MSNLRIACVTNTALDPTLGSGKTVLSWSTGLRNHGVHVDVYEPKDFYTPIFNGRLKRIKQKFDAIKLKRALKSGYDLVEFYGADFGWLSRGLYQLRDRPILTAHVNGLELLQSERLSKHTSGLWTVQPKKILTAPIDYLVKNCEDTAFRYIDKFVSICSLDARYIVEHEYLCCADTAVIEPGIDDEFLSSSAPKNRENRIVFFGSWTDRKDPDTIVFVVNKLLHTHESLHFSVLGAGGDSERIRAGFSDQVQSRITVHPKLSKSEIVQVLESAKVFFFPSIYEGYGMATAEAMACGCAAVVTPTGFGAMVKPDFEAVVCKFGDKTSMISSIERLLHDDELRLRIAGNGRQRVQELSWYRQSTQLFHTYSQWINDVRKTE